MSVGSPLRAVILMWSRGIVRRSAHECSLLSRALFLPLTSSPHDAARVGISRSYSGAFLAARRMVVTSVGANMNSLKTVGTHSGTFHCDEALGCFMIRRTDKFADANIVRTRDEKILATLDAVLDVGGVYNPETDRYDHHQRGFDEVFGHGFKTKLSSAGLVYKHFGEEIVAKELGLDIQHPDVRRVFLAVYRSFIEAVDANDNGINQYDMKEPPRFVNDTHLAARVGRLNIDWMEVYTQEKGNEAFHRAMALAGEEFLENVRSYATSWLPARAIVVESIAERNNVHESGEIVVLKTFCPWKQHLFEIEKELALSPSIKYVIYLDDQSKTWRVQAVSVAPGVFENRKSFPSPWRGLRDDELSSVTGVEGCIFCHIGGFIAITNTFEGSLALTKMALSYKESV